jgi:phosphoglycerol transferase MdoB-like AlkP superfamily enzyme
MGFDKLVFREEIIDELHPEDPEWTLADGQMFRLMKKQRTETKRFFEFSITGTSHTPFGFSLEEFPRTFFPDEDGRDYAYFDTIAYVDDAIGKYVDGLPDDTVVLIYGDHWSRVDNPEIGYHSQMIDEFGIVPAILFRKTKSGIEPLFSVDASWAHSAQLRLVDVTAWLRKSLGIQRAAED